MVRVIQVDDDGTEVAAIELDEFTVDILYSGIAVMLKDATGVPARPASPVELSRGALLRRAKILNRIQA
jgi:hypothetical protein